MYLVEQHLYSPFFAAPCPPSITSQNYNCATSTASFGWTNPMGNLGFLAQVAGAGYQDSCQTTNTSCAFQGLPCGLALNLTVLAQGAECNSSTSVSESLETGNQASQSYFFVIFIQYIVEFESFKWCLTLLTEPALIHYVLIGHIFPPFSSSVPCAPENVSAALLCSSRSALVSWAGSHGAVRYSVTLTAQDGHTLRCQSNSTSCQVADIRCGETYSITVTPRSETCSGHQSAVYQFRAGTVRTSEHINALPFQHRNIKCNSFYLCRSLCSQ